MTTAFLRLPAVSSSTSLVQAGVTRRRSGRTPSGAAGWPNGADTGQRTAIRASRARSRGQTWFHRANTAHCSRLQTSRPRNLARGEEETRERDTRWVGGVSADVGSNQSQFSWKRDWKKPVCGRGRRLRRAIVISIIHRHDGASLHAIWQSYQSWS